MGLLLRVLSALYHCGLTSTVILSLATLYFSSKLHLRHVVNTIVSKEIHKCLYEFFPLVPIFHSLSLYLA